MILSIGDKVRFLNETGEGIVTAIIGHDRVMVSVEDDFEWEMLSSQLVKISNIQDEPISPEVTTPGVTSTASSQKVVSKEGLFIVFVPGTEAADQDRFFSVLLVNNTNENILFSYYISERKEEIGINYGLMVPISKHAIHVVKQSETDHWDHIIVSAVKYKKGFNKAKKPFHIRLPFNQNTLSRSKHFKRAPLMEQDGFVFDLTEIQKKAEEAALKTVAQVQPKTKKEKESRKVKWYDTSDGYIEVDLHIESLIDHYSDMSNAEILEIQLSHFRNCLDEAILAEKNSIVFIHGVGKGKLKSEIIKIIESETTHTHRPGPSGKYGAGAIEVIIG